MTQEDKKLLLKDLCARLPYGVEVYNVLYKWEARPKGIVGDRLYFNDNPRYDGDCLIDEVKPYLRSMSSMTEEEKKEYRLTQNACDWGDYTTYSLSLESIDWLNAHHFDFRNLIEKGLVLEAPEGMYKTE